MGLQHDLRVSPREPKDDLTTALVRAEEAGDRLTIEELRANIGLLFAAGHETTAGQISSAILALHRHPDQLASLKKNPSLIQNAVEKMTRYDSAVQMTGRVTTEAVELGGVTIPANESVLALLGAANRDPAQYHDPDKLDIGRQNVRPMSFGGGIHLCLGAQLARLEVELAITALIERFPNTSSTSDCAAGYSVCTGLSLHCPAHSGALPLSHSGIGLRRYPEAGGRLGLPAGRRPVDGAQSHNPPITRRWRPLLQTT
jgi:cytochrome P450